MLRAEAIDVDLGGRPVLRGVSLHVAPGEVVALVGPNGCGKSTTLRVCAGILPPRAGSVSFDGTALAKWDRRRLAQRLAFVPQSPLLPPLYSVRDSVALGRTPFLSFLGMEGPKDSAVVQRALADAGVESLQSRRVSELSGGERQRVALARALAQQPLCLLLDEPTSNLDLRHEERALALLRRMAADCDFAALIVLHDLTVASHFCDRVLLMADGAIVAGGTPADVLTPDRLAAVYGTKLNVFPHPGNGRPVVVHDGVVSR